MNESLKVETRKDTPSFDGIFLTSLEEAANTQEVIDVARTLQDEAALLESQADAVVSTILTEDDGGETKGLNEKIRAAREAFRNKLRKFTETASFGAALIALHFRETPPVEETFSEMKERAKQEMKERGITMEQRQAYTKGINDLLYKSITPVGYSAGTDNDSLLGTVNGIRIIVTRFLQGLKEREEGTPGQEDAWRLYLGMPQKNNTFGISDFKPSRSKENKYYYTLNYETPSPMVSCQ